MRHMESTKIVPLIFPAAIDDADDPIGAYGDANPNSVDTLGWGRCDIYVLIGATDIAMAALGVFEGPAAASGADDGTYSAVTAATFGGSTGATRLPQAGDDNLVWHVSLDLTERERFLALDATAGDGTAGTFSAAFAILSEPNEHPNSATERGATGEIYA